MNAAIIRHWTWMINAEKLKIEELTTYVNGLKNDIEAVKNGIKYVHNNGLAEGSVNKIKLTKRIMYGRNSFALLKAKLLLNEYYYKMQRSNGKTALSHLNSTKFGKNLFITYDFPVAEWTIPSLIVTLAAPPLARRP